MAIHISTVFGDEQELLQSILKIHNKGKMIELDPMYNKGAFYKGMEKPKYRFDLNPRQTIEGETVEARDAKKPLEFQVESMIIDPPFLFNKWDKGTSITNRYSRYDTQEELIHEYDQLIKTAFINLKHNGLLVFKCQDLTTGGKTYMNSVNVVNLLIANGFYVKDRAILHKPNKIYKPNTIQRHLRKTHCDFFVAIKKGAVNAQIN